MDGRRLPFQRLPVNPRRHKVAPHERKRVARACNSCNIRRVRCSGQRPCTSCQTANRDCIYPAPVEKVSVPKIEFQELKNKLQLYEKALQVSLPDPDHRHQLLQDAAVAAASPSPLNTTTILPIHTRLPSAAIKTEPPDDHDTNARLLHDPDGTARFHGETSGATFIDHLKELIGAAVLPLSRQKPSSPQDGSAFLSSIGKCYTDDSRPLDQEGVDPLFLPTPDAMASMLSEVRYVIHDGNSEWPSGGIYWFGDLTQQPSLPVPPPNQPSFINLDAYRYLAFPQVTFAVAAFSTTAWPATKEHVELSDSFIARASALLKNPLDIGRCAMYDVSALVLMAFYLIEVYKRDSAYMHVATAAHLCIMLGVHLHRGSVDEKDRRVFWTVYIIDRWLSCLMGRPPVIAEDLIRIPLPSDVADLPPAAGIRAHVELSRISDYIVRNTHWIVPRETINSTNTEKTLCMLAEWKSDLPPCLQLLPDGLSSDPACVMLHMRYNQLIIVATRPLFIDAVKKSVEERFAPHNGPKEYNIQFTYLEKCIDAARRNIKLGRYFTTINRHAKPLHALQHYSFNAAVCLILESLVHHHRNDGTTEENASTDAAIQFTVSIHEPVKLKSDPNDKSCVQTLRDLRTLVTKLVAPAESLTSSISSLGVPQEAPRQESEPAMCIELMDMFNDDWSKFSY